MGSIARTVVFDHLGSVILALLKWGFLGLVLTIALYVIVCRLGGLRLGHERDRWLRPVTLVVWILIVPFVTAVVGVAFAGERIAAELVEKETVRGSRYLADVYAPPIVAVAVGVTGAAAGSPAAINAEEMRVETAALRKAEAAVLAELESRRAELIAKVGEESGTWNQIALWAVQAANHDMFEKPVEERLQIYREFVAALEKRQAADGTVGTAEMGEVIGTYMAPKATAQVRSVFSGFRLYLYLILLATIGLPLLISYLIARRNKAATV